MASLTLYFDRTCGRRLPEALILLGVPVEFQHSTSITFPANMPDDEWLAIIGQRGWIAVSHDRKWHASESELAAIKEHNVGCFYLWGAEAVSWEKMRAFARGYDNIMHASKTIKRPFIFDVSKFGKLMPVIVA